MEKSILLDSTGILYQHSNDIDDILLPFLRNLNCQFSDEIIIGLYKECCSGKCTTDEFWSYLLPGLEIPLDMIYAQKYKINEGITEFLKKAFSTKVNISCICNDNSEWVTRACRHYTLDYWIKSWLVSSEIGLPETDKRFFRHIINDLYLNPSDVFVVSTNETLLKNAFEEGMQPIQYGNTSEVYPQALTIAELSHLLLESKGELTQQR
jgi:FMN phosphatase YigB (HAD superfamily)